MRKHPFTPPEYKKTAFNCPYCNAYANHVWGPGVTFFNSNHPTTVKGVDFAYCNHCQENSIWRMEKLLFPVSTQAPQPNVDLPADLLIDYDEASSIVGYSPRGAAALLRLCLQKLCKIIGESGKDINQDISSLVKKGKVNQDIQKSLDIIRVVGNEAVHPGVIDLNDTPEIAFMLFKIINIIVDALITQPKAIQSLYSKLPANKLAGIVERDK